MICETCGRPASEAEGHQLQADDLRAAVQGGFEPSDHAFVRLPLEVQTMYPSRPQLLVQWQVRVLGPSSRPWFLCQACARQAKLAAFKARRGAAG